MKKQKNVSKDFSETKKLPEINLMIAKYVWAKGRKWPYTCTLNRVTVIQKVTLEWVT